MTSNADLPRSITLWRCPECEWVGYNEDGHCRQFDEHPDGPRIPLEAVDYLPAKSVIEALENGYHPQGPSAMHPADYVTLRFKLDGYEGLRYV